MKVLMVLTAHAYEFEKFLELLLYTLAALSVAKLLLRGFTGTPVGSKLGIATVAVWVVLLAVYLTF